MLARLAFYAPTADGCIEDIFFLICLFGSESSLSNFVLMLAFFKK